MRVRVKQDEIDAESRPLRRHSGLELQLSTTNRPVDLYSHVHRHRSIDRSALLREGGETGEGTRWSEHGRIDRSIYRWMQLTRKKHPPHLTHLVRERLGDCSHHAFPVKVGGGESFRVCHLEALAKGHHHNLNDKEAGRTDENTCKVPWRVMLCTNGYGHSRSSKSRRARVR